MPHYYDQEIYVIVALVYKMHKRSKDIFHNILGRLRPGSQSKARPPLPTAEVAPNTDVAPNIEISPGTEIAPATQGALTTQIHLPPATLWGQAFENVQPETRSFLGSLKTEVGADANALREELIRLARSKEMMSKDEAWTFKVGDKDILWRDYTHRVVTCLSLAGDIAITFAPGAAAGPWAAVKKLLQLHVDRAEAIAALMGSVDKVLRVFRCGNIYQRSFEAEKDIADEARENLHDALVDAYAKGLDVLAETHASLTKGVASQVLQQLIYPGHAKGRLSDLTASERTLRDCGSQCAESLGINRNEDIRDAIASLDRPLGRIDDMVKAIMAETSDKERLDWLKWISDIRYKQDHDEVKERRTEGTCSWLTENDSFQEWENASYSSVLWLRGSAGTGKTFLASNVIDYMRGSAKGSDEGFAFFYCSRLKEDNRRQPLSVFQSFVRQLSTSHRQEHFMRQGLLDLCKEKEAQGTVLRIPTCKEQIQAAANLYPRTTLIIDAFDECDGDDDGRVELVRFLAKLVRNSKHVVRVFITSRYDQDLASAFIDNPAALVEVTARQNHDDIKTFVRKELEKLKTRGNRMAIAKREEAILQKLDGQSNGMFQWARLMVDQLARSKSEEGLDEMINNTSLLPDALKGVYNSIYSSISTRADKEIVRRSMMWATASYELDIPALLDAVQLSGEDDQEFPTQGKVTLDQLMSLCSGFLNIVISQRPVYDEERSDFRKEWTVIQRPDLYVMQVAHASVLEYFEGEGWSLSYAKSYVSKACLRYLMGPLQGQLAEHIIGNWVWYVRDQEIATPDIDPQVGTLLASFLGTPGQGSPNYIAWQQCDSSGVVNRSPLPFAAYHGLYRLLQGADEWWDHLHIDDNETCALALSAAADQGHIMICKTLLNHCPQAALGFRWIRMNREQRSLSRCEVIEFQTIRTHPYSSRPVDSPLRVAAKNKWPTIVSLLLEGGADPNWESPLEWATNCGISHARDTLECISLLLQAGADPNWCGTHPFGIACAQNDVEIIQHFLKHGTEINATFDYNSGTATNGLIEATRSGKHEAVLELLAQGADPNITVPCGIFQFYSALTAAIWCDEEYMERYDTLQALPENKPDATSRLTQILLTRGADPNLLATHSLETGALYGSALVFAVTCGFRILFDSERMHTEAERWFRHGRDLRQHNPDTSPPRNQGPRLPNPVHSVKLLLDYGADPNIAVGRWGSALVAAAACGELESCRLLLTHGKADPFLKLQNNNLFGSALVATQSLDITYLRLLAETARGKWGYIPGDDGDDFDWNKENRIEISRLLLEFGVDVNEELPGSQYGSAIGAAILSGRPNCVRFLLEEPKPPADVKIIFRSPPSRDQSWNNNETDTVLDKVDVIGYSASGRRKVAQYLVHQNHLLTIQDLLDLGYRADDVLVDEEE